MANQRIEIIKCPRLNEGIHGQRVGSREIALKIGPPENDPVAIMCDNYDVERGECRIDFYEDNQNKTKYNPCIFSKWKPLKKERDTAQ